MNYTTPRDKTCPDCGQTFAAYSPKQKRCPECQRAHSIAANREKTNRWARAHATCTHEERKCDVCGRRFVPVRNAHNFCSTRCRNLAKWAEKVAARRGAEGKTASVQQQLKMLEEYRKRRKAELEKRRAARALDAAARKAARKIAREKKRAAAARRVPVATGNSKRPTASASEPWKARVERELAIPDPDARFAAAQKWTPKERKYAQKLAMRGMGWRGPAYGI
jgi:endogenous inhibitor of DNA gyrase (YacG/DUF329 family)